MLRTLRFLLEKEFHQIRRNKMMIRIIFVAPILQLLILPFAANFEMRDINLGVVDNDHSEASRRLVEKIVSSGYFKLSATDDNYDQGIKRIENDQSDILLDIPSGFARDLGREGTAQVMVAANAVNGMKGGMGSAYLAQIVSDYNSECGYTIATKGVTTSIDRYNPHLSYRYYMVSGILAALVCLISAFLSALNVVREKEIGTLEQINVTPVTRLTFILSKIIPFVVLGYVLFTMGVLVSWLVYGLLPQGSLLLDYGISGIALIAFSSFGLFISSKSSTQAQALFSIFFFFIIFMLMSGLFTPVNSMPVWAQRITLFNPMRYFVEIQRMIYLKGCGIRELATHVLSFTAFAVLFLGMAVAAYRKH